MHLVSRETKMSEFDQFWSAYPRKVARKAARQKFERARRLADMETIMAGLERYKRHKPDYADWCHAATWLHNERWEDEYETAPHDQRIAELIHGHS